MNKQIMILFKRATKHLLDQLPPGNSKRTQRLPCIYYDYFKKNSHSRSINLIDKRLCLPIYWQSCWVCHFWTTMFCLHSYDLSSEL